MLVLVRTRSRTSQAAALGMKGSLRIMQQQCPAQQLITLRLLLTAIRQMQQACTRCLTNSLGLKRSVSLLSLPHQRTLWSPALALLLQMAA